VTVAEFLLCTGNSKKTKLQNQKRYVESSFVDDESSTANVTADDTEEDLGDRDDEEQSGDGGVKGPEGVASKYFCCGQDNAFMHGSYDLDDEDDEDSLVASF
jgi:hypothetical protein